MMTNLFSSFDPSTTIILTSNWLSSFLFILFITGSLWFLPNRLNLIWQKVTMTLHQEFSVLLGINSLNGATIILISVFLLIFFNNFMGLYPYIFTSSSHLLMTLTISLPLWLAFMLFGWLTNTKHMFAHLVPQSTPVPLMPFMVIIETISNMIRPGTLAVRLAANMIAGHLLMTLLGNQTASVSVSIISILLMVQILLLTLESAVAIIQSYVFAVLTTLYSSEVTS